MNYLEGENILLRAPEILDIDLLYKWENDTTLWHIGSTLTPFSKYVLAKYLETAHLDIFETKQVRFMIDLKNQNHETIGCVDLFDYDPHHARAGVGILIADNSVRRKGYASEAIQVVKKYSFSVLGLHQLYCNIGVDNDASLQLFKNLGFEVIGLKKDWAKRGTIWFDEYLLQLINT